MPTGWMCQLMATSKTNKMPHETEANIADNRSVLASFIRFIIACVLLSTVLINATEWESSILDSLLMESVAFAGIGIAITSFYVFYTLAPWLLMFFTPTAKRGSKTQQIKRQVISLLVSSVPSTVHGSRAPPECA